MTGRSPKSVRAIENLRLACEQYLAEKYHVEIVDLLANPRLAADDQILAVPTWSGSCRRRSGKSSADSPTPTGS